MAALIMFGLWGLLSIPLLYLLFRRGKNSLAFALGLGAATAFIALLGLISIGLSRISEVLRHVLFILAIFSGGLPPFPDMMRENSPQLATFGALLLWLFSMSSADARVKQYRRIPENGARCKRDGETAICLWRRNMLRTCRLADIHAASAFT